VLTCQGLAAIDGTAGSSSSNSGPATAGSNRSARKENVPPSYPTAEIPVAEIGVATSSEETTRSVLTCQGLAAIDGTAGSSSSNSGSATAGSKRSAGKENIPPSDRPARPCPFCGKLKVRLTRHLRTVHKTEECVRNCMSGNDREKRTVFTQLNRTGILKHNMRISGHKGAVLQQERRSKSKGGVVVCDGCSGLFHRHWFSSQRKRCTGEQCIQPKPVAATLYYSSFRVDDDFKRDVLSNFSNDDVGKLCQENETMVMIGSKLYQKIRARKDKKMETKRSVMTDMRRLAHVFLRFRDLAQQSGTKSPTGDSVSVVDMFRRQNFNILEQAYSSYTCSTTDACKEKSGLSLAVYYFLVKAARIVKVYHWVNDDSVKATEVTEFLDVLNFSKFNMIGGAIYNTNQNRQTKLRRADSFPQIADVNRLRTYMQSRMKELLEDKYLQWTSAEFVELRDLACARVTLFNARRGGEPARLHLTHWSDACKKVWFDKERIQSMSAEEQELVSKSFVMYQTGKGVNHLVPVLVPEDTVPALEKLTDGDVRDQCGVSRENCYVFPSAAASECNVSGWHALSRVCMKAGVECSRITATKMRHLASTNVPCTPAWKYLNTSAQLFTLTWVIPHRE